MPDPNDAQRAMASAAEGDPKGNPAGADVNPAGDLDGGISVEDLKAKAASEKAHYEARIAELEDRMRQQDQRPNPPASATDEGDPVLQFARVDPALQHLVPFIAGDPARGIVPDPVARATAIQRMDSMRMTLEIQRLSTPEAIRDEVTERFQRGGFADINQARQAVEREKRDAEGKTKDAELTRLRAENERLAAAARANETHHVPGGSVREGPAPSPDGKTRMTFKEAEAMANQIRTTQGRAAAMEFQDRIGKDIEVT